MSIVKKHSQRFTMSAVYYHEYEVVITLLSLLTPAVMLMMKRPKTGLRTSMSERPLRWPNEAGF